MDVFVNKNIIIVYEKFRCCIITVNDFDAIHSDQGLYAKERGQTI